MLSSYLLLLTTLSSRLIHKALFTIIVIFPFLIFDLYFQEFIKLVLNLLFLYDKLRIWSHCHLELIFKLRISLNLQLKIEISLMNVLLLPILPD